MMKNILREILLAFIKTIIIILLIVVFIACGCPNVSVESMEIPVSQSESSNGSANDQQGNSLQTPEKKRPSQRVSWRSYGV